MCRHNRLTRPDRLAGRFDIETDEELTPGTTLLQLRISRSVAPDIFECEHD
jgi:hypothetical protein